MTKKGCEWIDFDIKNYNLSMTEIQKDKELVTQMQKRDYEVRDAFTKETVKYGGTKEAGIEAMKFKISEELVIHRKMQSLVFTTSE
jgi:hypothetical protein